MAESPTEISSSIDSPIAPPAVARVTTSRVPVLEKRLEDITRLVSDWIWEVDCTTRFTFVSHRVADILGRHPMALLGTSFSDIGTFIDNDGAGPEPDWLLPFRDRPFEAKDGSGAVRHLLISGVPIFDGHTGALTGVRGTARDITARRRAESELTRQKNMFESVFRDAPDAMAVVDADDRIIMCNPALSRIFGRSGDQLIGVSPAILYAGVDEYARHRRYLTQRQGKGFDGDQPKPFLGRFRRKGGEEFSGELVASSVTGADSRTLAKVLVIRDVTERERAEVALRDSEERFRNLVEGTVRGIVIDVDGRPIFANRAYAHIFGYADPAEILALDSIDSLYVRQEREHIDRFRRHRLQDGGASDQFEAQCIRRDGTLIWVEILLRSVNWNGQRAVQSTVVDISERKRTEAALRISEARFRAVIDNAPVGILLKDREGRVLMAGRQYEVWNGLSQGEILGKTIHDLLPPEQANLLAADDKLVIASGRGTQREIDIWMADGKNHTFLSVNFPIPGPDGDVAAIGVVNTDITQRKQAERELNAVQEELIRKANYDDLTGLPNRILFLDRLSQSLLRARRDKEIVALLFIELDHFKLVNDTLGHAAGDVLLRQTARRLSRCVREEDTVARLGGDEFTVILPGIDSGDDAATVASKIVRKLNRPFTIDGQEVFATASIGITLYPADGDDVETIVKNADAAMYSAKANGRNNYRFYTRELNDKAVRMIRMETLLRRALEQEELELAFQPIVDVRAGVIVGFEALVRWHSRELGDVSPDQFVSLAEDRGLIGLLGSWVLKTACREFKKFQSIADYPLFLAVNVSGRQFQGAKLLDLIAEALEESDLKPASLELEITEGVLMQNLSETMETLKAITDMGIGLSIDDFGTGYSSLSYLKRFPFTSLKIDRSFVNDVTDNPDDAALTKAIITMAHSLGLNVIGEGVENKEQLGFLLAEGCDLVQGFHYSRPLNAEQCVAFLRAAVGGAVQPYDVLATNQTDGSTSNLTAILSNPAPAAG